MEQLTTAQIAARVGITPSSWRAYVTMGKAPPADGHYDARTPWWSSATVDEWIAARRPPGRPKRVSETST